jgi:hypothetical protein
MTRVPSVMRRAVRERAGNRCEYCQLPEGNSLRPYEAEHIIAEQHGGTTELHNLAWACFICNKRKGPNIGSLDPETDELVRLYDPRREAWDDHFEIVDGEILGTTAEGRATVRLLRFNTPQAVELRRALIEAGMW